MLEVGEYLQKLIEACKKAFGDRLVYVGLQGSYMRDEATDKSDIDVIKSAVKPRPLGLGI